MKEKVLQRIKEMKFSTSDLMKIQKWYFDKFYGNCPWACMTNLYKKCDNICTVICPKDEAPVRDYSYGNCPCHTYGTDYAVEVAKRVLKIHGGKLSYEKT